MVKMNDIYFCNRGGDGQLLPFCKHCYTFFSFSLNIFFVTFFCCCLIEISNEELSAIDYDLYSKIFPEVTQEIEEEDGLGWYVGIGRRNNDAYPINIDVLIKHLEMVKKQGANYISLDYHTDHIGYIIEGLDISQSSEVEINEYLNKEKIRDKKLEEYARLKAQLNQLGKEL